MSLNPSTQFTAKNDLMYKTPMYLVEFQTLVGESYTISDVNPSYPIYLECSGASWTTDEWKDYTAVVTTAAGYSEYRVIASNTSNEITFYESLTNDSVAVGDSVRIDLYEKFCTYQPVPTATQGATPKPYVSFISGGGYSITPDEGSTSSATIKIEMQDHNDYITQMIYGATGRLQKKRCVVKAGYVGLTESQMLTIFTGEVTNYDYGKDGSWTFKVSDVIRALNKNIFRTASDSSPIVITGNPIDLLLGLLISDNGDGKKGRYDFLATGIGLDFPVSGVDIATFEEIRDTYYPVTSAIFHFEVTQRESANDFFKKEIFKPLNMYPVILGDGRYSARIYRPVLPPYSAIEINEHDMLDIPSYSGNLGALINEVQFSYNYNGDDFEDIDVYADAESINTRGVGDNTLEIESKGINSAYMDTEGFVSKSASRIFLRYANPPIQLKVKTHFKDLVIEAGDIVSVSNKFLPNLATGNFDLENVQMEVLKRTVDWKRGSVSLELLQTGYEQNKYAAISPILTVASYTAPYTITVTDSSFFEAGFVLSHWRKYLDVDTPSDWSHIEHLQDDLVIDSISGNDVILTTTPTTTPIAGDVFTFTDTGSVSTAQEPWGRIGAGYVITP